MRAARLLLLLAGVLLALYGGWLLVSRQSVDQLLQVAAWAVAGVVLHDAVLAPVVLALGWLVLRGLRPRAGGVVALALLLVGTLTLAAVPAFVEHALGQGNPTLVDRDYRAGWLVAVAAVLLGVVLVQALARLRRKEPHGGARGG